MMQMINLLMNDLHPHEMHEGQNTNSIVIGMKLCSISYLVVNDFILPELP